MPFLEHLFRNVPRLEHLPLESVLIGIHEPLIASFSLAVCPVSLNSWLEMFKVDTLHILIFFFFCSGASKFVKVLKVQSVCVCVCEGSCLFNP